MTVICHGRFAPVCRLSRAICRIATGKALLGSFIVCLVFAVLIMGKPFGIARLQEITGGATIPDMTFTTGPDSVYAVLGALGEAGRTFDLTHIVPLDLVYPFTYGLFLSLGISWALARVFPGDSPWRLLNIIPVLAAAADYAENAGVIALLLTYPVRLDPVAWFVSSMYSLKFVLSAISFTTLLAALAASAVTAALRWQRRSPA